MLLERGWPWSVSNDTSCLCVGGGRWGRSTGLARAPGGLITEREPARRQASESERTRGWRAMGAPSASPIAGFNRNNQHVCVSPTLRRVCVRRRGVLFGWGGRERDRGGMPTAWLVLRRVWLALRGPRPECPAERCALMCGVYCEGRGGGGGGGVGCGGWGGGGGGWGLGGGDNMLMVMVMVMMMGGLV